MIRIWYLCVTETGPAIGFTELDRALKFKELQECEVYEVQALRKIEKNETD